jgi:hypothetical protein
MLDIGMTKGLVRYQECGCLHFIPFSCRHRLPFLGTTAARSLFERSLEAMRRRLQFSSSSRCLTVIVTIANGRPLRISTPSTASMRKDHTYEPFAKLSSGYKKASGHDFSRAANGQTKLRL